MFVSIQAAPETSVILTSLCSCSLYSELMSFLNVVLIAPQLSGEPTLLLSCLQELRGSSWKSWGTDSEGVDRHTCDYVNQTNRLFGENRLQVCEACVHQEHSQGGTPPLQVWTVLGRKALDTEMSEWDNSAQD